MQFRNGYFKTGIVALLCLPLVITGCAEKSLQPENMIIVEKEEEGIEYNLTVATLGDVTLTKRIKCTYTQVNEQDVSFPVSGRRISRVYVEKGDSVKKGQLIAELSTDNLASQIENLEYKISRNNLLLSQLYANQERGIEKILLQYPLEEDTPDYEKDKLNKKREDAINALLESNEYSIEDYQDAITLDTLELEGLQSQLNSSFLYAEMDGIIADIKERLEGSTSVANETIFRILDDSECIFSVTDLTYIDYFKNDASVSMSVNYGKGQGSYELVPYRYGEWSDTMYFSILIQPDGAVLEVGDTGSIDLVLDSRSNVLCLPVSAVHEADGEEYVYILNEDNVREVKWIKTGLHGDTSIEILSNLEEGDKVFLR